jgi:hypothetical protein
MESREREGKWWEAKDKERWNEMKKDEKRLQAGGGKSQDKREGRRTVEMRRGAGTLHGKTREEPGGEARGGKGEGRREGGRRGEEKERQRIRRIGYEEKMYGNEEGRAGGRKEENE